MANLKLCGLESSINNELDFLGICQHSETGEEFRIYGDLLKRDLEDIKLGFYKHKKSRFYEVIGTAEYPETKEKLVVYKGMYKHEKRGKEALWVRPLKMFLENDERGNPRFKYIE